MVVSKLFKILVLISRELNVTPVVIVFIDWTVFTDNSVQFQVGPFWPYYLYTCSSEEMHSTDADWTPVLSTFKY